MREIASRPAREITTFRLRSHVVILDHDLAAFYGVPTKILNAAVKRIIDRFPEDFMFQLTADETQGLKDDESEVHAWLATLRRNPYAFTEQGIHAISYFLKSPRAVKISVELIKTFHTMRESADDERSIFETLEQMRKRQDLESKRLWELLRSVRQLEEFREDVSRKMGRGVGSLLTEQSRQRLDRMRWELDQIERRAMGHRELFYLIVLIFGALLSARLFFPR